MDYLHLLILGLLAGGTIFIGMLIGRFRLQPNIHSSLSMIATGILIFLLVEILGDATGETTVSLQQAVPGNASLYTGIFLVFLLVGGFYIGLVGLARIQQKVAVSRPGEVDGKHLSFMIAIGIGFHNLSEGLAIGQSFIQGKSALAMGLVIGFALHNATEGFGIIAPSVNGGKQVAWKSILLLGVIGGGPTFIGTLLGSLWTSTAVSVLVLSVAAGTILFVIKELLASVRRETAQHLVMTALVIGFGIGWITALIITLAT